MTRSERVAALKWIVAALKWTAVRKVRAAHRRRHGTNLLQHAVFAAREAAAKGVGAAVAVGVGAAPLNAHDRVVLEHVVLAVAVAAVKAAAA